MDKKTYSNPRKAALIKNWPMGGGKRGDAYFYIFEGNKGERAHRQTNINGVVGKEKKLTFAHQMRIVDGSDGRTYIAAKSDYGFVTIWRGDMKFQEETIHETDERFESVRELFPLDVSQN